MTCVDCGKPMNPVERLISAAERCGPCIRRQRPRLNVTITEDSVVVNGALDPALAGPVRRMKEAYDLTINQAVHALMLIGVRMQMGVVDGQSRGDNILDNQALVDAVIERAVKEARRG